MEWKVEWAEERKVCVCVGGNSDQVSLPLWIWDEVNYRTGDSVSAVSSWEMLEAKQEDLKPLITLFRGFVLISKSFPT